MTEQETIKIVTLIVMSYPAADKFKDDNTIKAMVSVWTQIFKDDNPRLVELAVQRHIATNKWPPNIAEIREQMASLEHPELIPPDAAWTAVSNLLYAVGEYDYENEHENLPPLITQAVDAIGWHALYQMHCESYRGNRAGMDRLAFMQQYTPMYERERERAMLPKTLADSVGKIELALGGEAYRQIEAARRRREDRMRDNILESGWLLEQANRQRLSGGKNDV